MTLTASNFYLTDRELAARLCIAYRTVHNWRASDPSRLPKATNIGTEQAPRWRTSIKDFEDFMANNASQGVKAKKRVAKSDDVLTPNRAEAIRRVQVKLNKENKTKE